MLGFSGLAPGPVGWGGRKDDREKGPVRGPGAPYDPPGPIGNMPVFLFLILILLLVVFSPSQQRFLKRVREQIKGVPEEPQQVKEALPAA